MDLPILHPLRLPQAGYTTTTTTTATTATTTNNHDNTDNDNDKLLWLCLPQAVVVSGHGFSLTQEWRCRWTQLRAPLARGAFYTRVQGYNYTAATCPLL